MTQSAIRSSARARHLATVALVRGSGSLFLGALASCAAASTEPSRLFHTASSSA
jgi:hypothetical protein